MHRARWCSLWLMWKVLVLEEKNKLKKTEPTLERREKERIRDSSDILRETAANSSAPFTLYWAKKSATASALSLYWAKKSATASALSLYWAKNWRISERDTCSSEKSCRLFLTWHSIQLPPSHTHTHVRMILQNIRYYVRKVYYKHIVVDHWKQKIYSFFIYKKNPPSYPHIHAENIFCTARCVTDAQMNFVFICSL